jgi:hypothetical protein
MSFKVPDKQNVTNPNILIYFLKALFKTNKMVKATMRLDQFSLSFGSLKALGVNQQKKTEFFFQKKTFEKIFFGYFFLFLNLKVL